MDEQEIMKLISTWREKAARLNEMQNEFEGDCYHEEASLLEQCANELEAVRLYRRN